MTATDKESLTLAAQAEAAAFCRGHDAGWQSCAAHIAAQATPLTDSHADDLAREMVKGGKSVNWLVRAVERAHGIKA